jgi:Ras-related protein Rab-11A
MKPSVNWIIKKCLNQNYLFIGVKILPVYKIAVFGDGGVGKSSLLEARKTQKFDENSKITIGVDYKLIPFETRDCEEDSTFLAMDLGGQERFQFIHDSYINGIKGALILFDVSRIRTFRSVDHWLDLINKENDNIPILIIGNKLDLIDPSEKGVFIDMLESFIQNLPENNNIYGFYFTSAKTLTGINETFAICEEMILGSTDTNPRLDSMSSEKMVNQLRQLIT